MATRGCRRLFDGLLERTECRLSAALTEEKRAVIHARIFRLAGRPAGLLDGFEEMLLRFRRRAHGGAVQGYSAVNLCLHPPRRRLQRLLERNPRRFVMAERKQIPREIVAGVLVPGRQL